MAIRCALGMARRKTGIMSSPAGWYPQPDGQQRYWDGELWTEHFTPGVPPETPKGVARRNWFLRHKILTAIGALLLLGTFSGLAGAGNTKSITIAPVVDSVTTSAAPDQAAADQAAAETAAAEKAAAEVAATEAAAAAEKAAAEASAQATADAAAAQAITDAAAVKATADAVAATNAKAAAEKKAQDLAAAAARAEAAAAAAAAAPPPAPPAAGVYYENCTAARAAGVTPIYRGQPGYALKLDRDKDGIACE
jgi:cytoskeletal protein RodZ